MRKRAIFIIVMAASLLSGGSALGSDTGELGYVGNFGELSYPAGTVQISWNLGTGTTGHVIPNADNFTREGSRFCERIDTHPTNGYVKMCYRPTSLDVAIPILRPQCTPMVTVGHNPSWTPGVGVTYCASTGISDGQGPRFFPVGPYQNGTMTCLRFLDGYGGTYTACYIPAA